MFAVAPEPADGLDAEPDGRLEVRELHFTYPGQERAALRDVSFSLEPGNGYIIDVNSDVMFVPAHY